jgi:hypothetical protein
LRRHAQGASPKEPYRFRWYQNRALLFFDAFS